MNPFRLLSIVLLFLLAGCSSTIVPPERPEDAVSVFVLDHGRHSSLVLPLQAEQAGEPAAVRYSYGDWDYYVLRRTGFKNAARALFRATPAALGQEFVEGPYEIDAIRQNVQIEVIEALEIRVDAGAAHELRAELGELFEAQSHTLKRWPGTNVYFVRHPQDYTLLRNSNQMVGDWLQTLGCTIRGKPILSNWRLAPAGQEN